MTENNAPALPKDQDSDYSFPGRFDDRNLNNFNSDIPEPKSTNKFIFLIIAILVVFLSGVFSFYFLNQTPIDSPIIQNALDVDPEKILINQYGIGKYGIDHAHAAIIVAIDDIKIDFGLPQFQLSNKYIHFENYNSYLIHKHATGAPLKMLFESVGIKITNDCIILNYGIPDNTNTKKFCVEEDASLNFYVNGKKFSSDITLYVIEHNDRILISLGDGKLISKQLEYLQSLEIYEVPKKTPSNSGNDLTI